MNASLNRRLGPGDPKLSGENTFSDIKVCLVVLDVEKRQKIGQLVRFLGTLRGGKVFCYSLHYVA